MDIQVHISGLVNDPKNNAYIVVLKGEGEKQILPIWVGELEAGAIAMALEAILPPRPMTHDLMKNIFDAGGISVERITITDLKDHTFFAVLHLFQNGRHFEMDSRPSDALAIALRNSAPIYVTEEALEKQTADSINSWLRNFEKDDRGYNA